MRPVSPFAITAAATAPKKEPWFAIRASTTGAELRLRGYIGEASSSRDYWTDQVVDTGGMGTLKEFEDALLALGDVTLITVYLTSEGGDFPTAVAISSILARQSARIVCVIDGYAYSAAPVIACAADEVRAAKNAILMIHDAEFWCQGADIEAMRQNIATLEACNNSMAAAFQNKAGGTVEEWMQRMVATTWMTGEQARDLGLVDVVLGEVALSAYQPLKRVTAAHKPPATITALIDTAAATPSAHSMKATPALLKLTALYGIKLTAEADEAAVNAAIEQITAAKETSDAEDADEEEEADDEAEEDEAEEDEDEAEETEKETTAASKAKVTAKGKTAKLITAAVKPLQDQIKAQAKELKHLKGLSEHGLGGKPGSPTAAAEKPAAPGKPGEEPPATTPRARAITAAAKMTIFQRPAAAQA